MLRNKRQYCSPLIFHTISKKRGDVLCKTHPKHPPKHHQIDKTRAILDESHATSHPTFSKMWKKSGLNFFYHHFLYGACLILLALTGCSTPACREWEIHAVKTRTPCFNGGRLLLGPDSDYSNLELELVRTSSGIRFYIDLLLLEALPWKEDPARTTVTIQFEEQEPWVIHPYLFNGGQRLLIPGDEADLLVQALLDGFSFTIKIGRSQICVIPNKFTEGYTHLLDIPIEESL